MKADKEDQIPRNENGFVIEHPRGNGKIMHTEDTETKEVKSQSVTPPDLLRFCEDIKGNVQGDRCHTFEE